MAGVFSEAKRAFKALTPVTDPDQLRLALGLWAALVGCLALSRPAGMGAFADLPGFRAQGTRFAAGLLDLRGFRLTSRGAAAVDWRDDHRARLTELWCSPVGCGVERRAEAPEPARAQPPPR